MSKSKKLRIRDGVFFPGRVENTVTVNPIKFFLLNEVVGKDLSQANIKAVKETIHDLITIQRKT